MMNLIFDPIPFSGGSKVATSCALSHCDSNQTQFTVVTASPKCWKNSELNTTSLSIVFLPCPGWLAHASSGLGYWLKQGYFSLFLVFTLLRIPKITNAIGASGPGVDMALYLCKFLFGYRIIQLIHGPVGLSRSIGYCLTKAHHLFYLPSSRSSIIAALKLFLRNKINIDLDDTLANAYLNRPHCQTFTNGLSRQQWPTQCQYDEPRLFWSASLLKWKGLDLLTDCLTKSSNSSLISTNICYIKPKNTALTVSDAPIALNGVTWFEQPENLDEIRAESNIYISTSTNEPFGLATLEAMAAGMCIIIPSDGAYWDTVLSEDVHCIKYLPNDVNSLKAAINKASSNTYLIPLLGMQAKRMAMNYRAESVYQSICDAACTKSNDFETSGPLTMQHNNAAHYTQTPESARSVSKRVR
ncbi:glycosyltransferase [Vibrio tapetis subsp. quintayensis]|uniref:glycosyltransferase n=1 Tax=Vibrio tapetis TaxID=52443 RepID=UPI0025B30C02|nr:glycosyltransferase [Vibrio tapetis]MDN3680255.1 glycosyltransferase [Vibrio tapetis subsp. quintayensis]